MQARLRALIVLGALAASTLTAGASQASAAAAGSVDLRPGALSRGPDAKGPHLQGRRTIVDGDVRVRLAEPVLSLLGGAGEGYVAVVGTGQGEDARVGRVRRDGSVRTIAPGFPRSLTLSGDGSKIAFARGNTAKRTKILVKSSAGGPVLAKRAFPGSVSVLDVTGSRAVLGSSGPDRTLTWDFDSNKVRLVVRKTGYVADKGANRFAYFTGDPYFKGCSAVAALNKPRKRISKSCAERVESFNANGKRMATIDILADGLGPRTVWVRKTSGRKLAAYSAYYFGTIRWETHNALLLETFADRQTTIARCVKLRCEAAAPVRRAPAPRVPA